MKRKRRSEQKQGEFHGCPNYGRSKFNKSKLLIESARQRCKGRSTLTRLGERKIEN